MEGIVNADLSVTIGLDLSSVLTGILGKSTRPSSRKNKLAPLI